MSDTTESPWAVLADDDVALWATISGRGRSAVLCHGGPGVWDYLESLADLLDGLVQSTRYDQRGCGRSAGRDGPFTLQRAIADLDVVRAAAAPERAILVGHSWGATLALHYALAHPDRTAGVIYIAGVGIEWQRWKHAHVDAARLRLGPAADRVADLRGKSARTPAEESEYLVRTWTVDHPDDAVGRSRAEAMIAQGFSINDRANALLNRDVEALDATELIERCRSLEVAVLVIDGGLDPRPNAAVDSLVAALPHVARHVIAGGGHYPWLDAPPEFRSVVAEWLATAAASVALTPQSGPPPT